MIKIRNEVRDITTDHVHVTKKYHENFCANKGKNDCEIGKFL